MKLIIADEAGFCFGVKRALRLTNELLQEGKAIQTYGPLIHNQTVLENLRQKGIEPIESLSALDRRKTLVIRTHGVPKTFEERLQHRKINYLDATCPLVKRIHRIIARLQEQKIPVVLVGDAKHPEIVASRSFAKNVIVIHSPKEASHLDFPDRIGVVAQSTLNKQTFTRIVAILRKKSRHIQVFDTICQATVVRQEAVRKMARRVDAVVVIGSKNSSNTQKLVEIASDRNPHVFSLESHIDLKKPKWRRNFEHFRTIGITAGASTPPSEIAEVKNFFLTLCTPKEKRPCPTKRK